MPLIELIVTISIPVAGIYYGIKSYIRKQAQKTEILNEEKHQLKQDKEIIKNSNIFLNLYTITGTVNLIFLIVYIIRNVEIFNTLYNKHIK